jgi:hypothetical protein
MSPSQEEASLIRRCRFGKIYRSRLQVMQKRRDETISERAALFQ